MIFRNQEEVNFSSPKTDSEKFAKAKIKELEENIKIGKPLIIKRKIALDRDGNLKQPTQFPLMSTRRNDDGVTEEWMYCKTAKVVDGARVGDRFYMIVRNTKQINDPEQAFMLKYKVDLHKKGLYIENKEEESKKLNAKEALGAEVKYLVTSERGLGFNAIQLFARSYNINNIQNKGEQELRRELFEKIKSEESKTKDGKVIGRGFDDFLREVDGDGERVKMRAYVNEALNKKIIRFDGGSHAVYYGESDRPFKHIAIMRWGNKEDELVKWLLGDEEAKRIFMTNLEGAANDIAALTEDYANMHISTVRSKMVKNLGFSNSEIPDHATKKVLLEMIDKKKNTATV